MRPANYGLWGFMQTWLKLCLKYFYECKIRDGNYINAEQNNAKERENHGIMVGVQISTTRFMKMNLEHY